MFESILTNIFHKRLQIIHLGYCYTTIHSVWVIGQVTFAQIRLDTTPVSYTHLFIAKHRFKKLYIGSDNNGIVPILCSQFCFFPHFLEQMLSVLVPEMVIGRKDNVNIVSWLLTDYRMDTVDQMCIRDRLHTDGEPSFLSKEIEVSLEKEKLNVIVE